MNSILLQPRANFSAQLLLALLLIAVAASVRAAPPVVSSIRASQRAGTQLVDIYYNVSDADSAVVSVSLAISSDGGASYSVPAYTFSGAHGAGVAVGNDRHIAWNAGSDWGGRFSTQCKVRIFADDGSGAVAPPGMSLIPAGTFQMGDNFGLQTEALPVHTVFVSACFMDQTEVTAKLWDEVRAWAGTNGYSISAGGNAGQFHPIASIDWFDVIRWCNARSEKEGLTPSYYTTSAQTTVYRTPPNVELSDVDVRWQANGYRLPTEAEWEKAARGGLVGQHYPWASTGPDTDVVINGSQANFYQSDDPFEINSPATTPVGFFTNWANGYGLYDMAGNAFERCWDRYSPSAYPSVGTETNPHGPNTGSGSFRVIRGGAYNDYKIQLRCARRDSLQPGSLNAAVGFRCVRNTQ